MVTEALRAPPAAAPTALFSGTRPLKRWRYVGIFCERFMACAAIVHVGPLKQSFWALYDREQDELRERTRLRPRRGEVLLEPGRLRVRDRGVSLELELGEGPGIEALCPHGRGIVWTRKQAGVPARGHLALDGAAAQPVHARAVIDDTAGHHSRHTEWFWSAGVGEGPDGGELAWNLVSGVNDPGQGSERAVWVQSPTAAGEALVAGDPLTAGDPLAAGEALVAGDPLVAGEALVAGEPPPVSFAGDLSSIRCEDGSELRFSAEAQRRRSDNFVVLSSDYQAPFGSFAGTLPGHVELRRGLGVMEHHRARW